jgi:hypothetical protein
LLRGKRAATEKEGVVLIQKKKKLLRRFKGFVVSQNGEKAEGKSQNKFLS